MSASPDPTSEASGSAAAPLPYITLHSRHDPDSEPRPDPGATTQAPPGGRDTDHATGYGYGHNAWHPAPHHHHHGYPGGDPRFHGHGHGQSPGHGHGYGHGHGHGHSYRPQAATHDISRVSYHVKNVGRFAETLEESAKRAFPNRGQPSRRYNKVFAVLVHWQTDDLFVMPELNDLERCLRNDYFFETETFAIPPTNSHLELMLRVAQLIKDHEAPDTLFVLYYGGHAKIDDARQSTWVATRQPNSPWLQWSAVQTLLERSASDVLILLDCCSGAASAAFPAGCTSITETISASSWNAIAPEPGRYSFTNILIEVLQEWRERTFSAAMLHAEMLARLKHPRPVVINGQICESRATPVHFMMTANHKAPSIEIARMLPLDWAPPSPSLSSPFHASARAGAGYGQGPPMVPGGRRADGPVTGPNEDTPHVMISLALEDNQELNIEAWEQWLAAFPALAKYVKVQGVFKSHSTLLLLSMPVMIWDMLPDDYATNFVAFIRSDNMAAQPSKSSKVAQAVTSRAQQKMPTHMGPRRGPARLPPDNISFNSESTTLVGTENGSIMSRNLGSIASHAMGKDMGVRPQQGMDVIPPPPTSSAPRMRSVASLQGLQREASKESETSITKRPIVNQVRSAQWSALDPSKGLPPCPQFAVHVEARLETYFQQIPWPNNNQREFIASNLGIEPYEVEVWFYYREEREKEEEATGAGAEPMMISGPQLSRLLEILPPEQVLIIDVRPRKLTRYVINDAIHMRMPLGFIETAPLDLIGRAFRYNEDLESFAAWKTTSCLVFYTDDARFAWECPTADGLYRRLREEGWAGQCFVLSGTFGEFREAFPQHVSKHAKKTRVEKSKNEDRPQSNNSGSQEASLESGNESADGAEQPGEDGQQTTEISEEVVEGYKQWLDDVCEGGSGEQQPSQALTPAAMADRVKARDQRERDVANEFIEAFPVLYKASHQYATHPPSSSKGKQKADDSESFTLRAQMVPYLESGLSKIREASSKASGIPVGKKLPEDDDGHVQAEVFAPRSPSDEYVKVGDGDSSHGSSSGSLHNMDKKKVAEADGTSTLKRGWKRFKVFGRS